MKTLTEHNKSRKSSFESTIGEKSGVLCPICKVELFYSKAGYNKKARGYYVFCSNADCMRDEDWIFVGIKLI